MRKNKDFGYSSLFLIGVCFFALSIGTSVGIEMSYANNDGDSFGSHAGHITNIVVFAIIGLVLGFLVASAIAHNHEKYLSYMLLIVLCIFTFSIGTLFGIGLSNASNGSEFFSSHAMSSTILLANIGFFMGFVMWAITNGKVQSDSSLDAPNN